MKKFTLALSLTVMLLFLGFTGTSVAQSTTSGDIAGVVSDSTGAVIPNAKITVTNAGTGESQNAVSSAAGGFRVSLLQPGAYKVVVVAPGFSTSNGVITVAAGQIATDNVKLTVGDKGTVVEVTTEPVVMNTENGDVTTAFTAEQVQALPNPGNDLTFVAQTAPGSVMNTGTAAGGYGNFSSFGVSGLSNMFTLDGGYENDPFLNLNNTGASNLTLGNNEVDTVTVVSPAYSSQYGGLGGAQVNEITQGGGNRIHGNASYYWDGRALNSNDWFNKQNQAFSGTQNIPVFVNANQWGASVGGPIIKDRLFWFVNTEGIRTTTPASGIVGSPSTLLQNCTLGLDPGGTVNVAGAGPGGSTIPQTYADCATLNSKADADCYTNASSSCVGQNDVGYTFTRAAASQLPLMKSIFGVYNGSPYRAGAITVNPNDVAANSYYANSSSRLSEWLLTGRVDWKIGDKDNFYIHYKQDHGQQPTYTDLVSPLFTDQSLQPAWEGEINETHVFTPNLVNQLVLTGNYYSAPFENTNNYFSVAPSTVVFVSGDITQYGGINYDFPQGRNVAGYQIIDDASYTKGRNTVRWGYNFRRDNITDIQGVETTTPVDETSLEGFTMGTDDYEFIQRFPRRPTQPVSVYNQGAYIENAYKLTPSLIVTAGLRVERNSNPTCHTNCFQDLAYTTASMPTGTASTTTAYNSATPGGYISAGRHRAFQTYEKAGIMPRVSFNWSPTSKTVIRGGFGMFTDTFPGLIADDLLSNAPTNFHGAVYGALNGGTFMPLTPSTVGSGTIVAAQSNAAFQTQFTSGGNYNTTKAAVAAAGGVYSTPSFTTTAPSVKYPTYEEFSMAIEQRLDSKTTITATYVGNHGYHEPIVDGTRNLSTAARNTGAPATFFPAIPSGANTTVAKPVQAFATVTNVYSGGSSNFNGVVLSATRRSKSLTLQFNYEYSKALDEVSNGGLEAFAPDAGDTGAVSNPANLAAQYGPADYNVKHNITSSFVYELPSFVKSSNLMRNLTGGFEFSGDAFHNSGLPYSVTQSISSIGTTYINPATNKPLTATFANGSTVLFARQLTNNFDHHCGGGNHAALPDGSVPNQCGFSNSFAFPTNFGQGSRNSLVGPSYTNVNFGAFKTIVIPHYEFMKLKLGAQFFNLFNHPNFQNPSHVVSATSQGSIGGISSTVGAPTSILGSTGGADATPRLIQLHAALTF